MPDELTPASLLYRDGTSQAGRLPAALDPATVPVDERSVRDLLAFAAQLAARLTYVDRDNQPAGHWLRFFAPHLDVAALDRLPAGLIDSRAVEALLGPALDEAAAYAESPASVADIARIRWRRPHFALFLTCLRLLQQAQRQLNGFSRRHLEYFYRDVLRLTPLPGKPNHVHLLIELIEGQSQFLLPAGTELGAGQDRLGTDIIYRTDNDLVVNRTRVAGLKSLYAQQTLIQLSDIRRRPECLLPLIGRSDPAWLRLAQPDKSLLAMLEAALGDPHPGNALPPYPVPVAPGGNVAPGPELLANWDAVLGFIRDQLAMPVPVFRALIEARQRLAPDQSPARGQWARVNALLAQAAAAGGRPNWAPTDPADFPANHVAAFGLEPGSFDGLSEVKNLYALYRRIDDDTRTDIRPFIKERLRLSVDDFRTMMQIVADDMQSDWRRIYDILRAAGRRKRPAASPVLPDLRSYHPARFEQLLDLTLGPRPPLPSIAGTPIADLDALHAELLRFEDYLAMPAEDYGFVREVMRRDAAARPWEWAQVEAVIEQAYRQSQESRRRAPIRAQLRSVHRQTRSVASAIEAGARLALGDPAQGGALPGGRALLSLRPELPEDLTYAETQLGLGRPGLEFLLDLARQDANPDARSGGLDWVRVARVLAAARDRKENWTPPPLEFRRWENLYAADDATRVLAQPADERGDATPHWRTFGAGPEAGAATAAARIGFAVASPILLLAEGRRVVTLTLECAPDSFDADALQGALRDAQGQTLNPLACALTTEKNRFEVPPRPAQEMPGNPPSTYAELRLALPVTGGPSASPALQIVLVLGPEAPPIAAGPGALPHASPWPVLEILLRDTPVDGGLLKAYGPFRALRLERIRLQVEVDGLTDLRLQNEGESLNPKKPFEPFGPTPISGSRLWLAHRELCTKRLEELRLQFEWMGVPDNLQAHYSAWGPFAAGAKAITDNTSLTAALQLYDRRALTSLTNFPLFHAEAAGGKVDGPKTVGATKPHLVTITPPATSSGYDRVPWIATADEPLAWDRHWRLDLGNVDFQHLAFGQAAAGAALRRSPITPAPASGPATQPDPLVLNPPYTPKLQKLQAGYRSSIEFRPGAQDPELDQLFHLAPFGVAPAPLDESGQWPLLPQIDGAGELYLGLAGVEAPQAVAVLFQVAEGSADPDLPAEPVRWDYLSGDQWRTLERGGVLSDTTLGLLNTGIVTFALPPAVPGTLLPADRYWLRASIARHPRSVGDLVDVRAQAVRATFVDRGNAPELPGQPLPAGSIAGPVQPLPEVKKVEQPFTSSGGAGPEAERAFDTRVSERLRHRNRAVTSWDYERLILQEFPEVYKAKALPVGSFDDPVAANEVRILVIPNIRGKLPFDPFAPKVPADLLESIAAHVRRHAPPFARVVVRNPRYLQLKLRFSVRLRPAGNAGFYLEQLHGELQRYLAPWAYDAAADIVFGGRINTNLIVNFLEERPYVDFVAGLKLFAGADGIGFREVTGPEAGLATLPGGGPDVILVSARSHQIDLIGEARYEDDHFFGLNYMKIELDFQVA